LPSEPSIEIGRPVTDNAGVVRNGEKFRSKC
jgi:hypothetical protein